MKVALIGDSHSQVTAPMIADLIRKKGDVVTDIVSKAGWGIKSFLDSPQVLESLLASNPDAIIVLLGGNNHILDDLRYREQMNRFLLMIGYPKRKIIWVAPATAIRNDVEIRHDWTDKWLKKNLPKPIKYISSKEYTTENHRDDGVHFTRQGYQYWVDNIWGKISQAISIPIVLYKARQSTNLKIVLSLGITTYLLWKFYGYTNKHT